MRDKQFVPFVKGPRYGYRDDSAITRIARAHQAQPFQVALAWLLQRSPIMLPIPATSSVEHLEENLGAASLRLNGDEFRQLSEVKTRGEFKR